MEAIRKNLLRLRCLFVTHDKKIEQQQQMMKEITKFDTYLGLCHKVLCWEDISFTLTTFLAVNFLFWITTLLQTRFFGLIFLLILIVFVIDSIVDLKQYANIDLERLEKLECFRNEISDFWYNIRAYRKDNPSSFCFSTTIFSLILTILARNISGYILTYFLILTIFFGPLLFSLLPPEISERIKQVFTIFNTDRGVLAEDELIPFLSDVDERDGDQDSLMTDRTAESVTNSLVSGLSAMPSHLDADDKESLDEDDLLPTAPEQIGTGGGLISLTPGDLSSDSDIENKEIRFDSSHFNTDNSSSSSDNDNNHLHEKDLQSLEIDQHNHHYNNELVENVISNLVNVANVSSNLMVNAIKTAVGTALTTQQQSKQQKRDNSSDSEFEIIEYDEADN